MKRHLLAGVATVALLVAGCGEEPGEATHPLLEDPTPAETPAATGAQATGAPTPLGFPQECDQLVPFVRVAEIVAVPMAGTSRVYQDEFPAESGRLERLTCNYGTEPADDGQDQQESEPYVTIAVSSYTDAGSATARVEATVDSARTAGQQVEAMEIAGRGGFFLRDDETVSYVVAADELTYVVTVRRDAVEDPAEQVVMVTMVEQLLSTDQ